MKKVVLLIYLVTLTALSGIMLISCGESEQQDSSRFSNQRASGNPGNVTSLSDFELEHGIGPIKQIMELTSLDNNLAKEGEKIFDSKCAACHKLDDRYVGPPQRDVLERRTPEFVMNMMLNPEENYQKHPEIKKLLGEYLTQMPNQNLSVQDARAVLEYFRKVKDEK
ncbi:MAG TPA: cytochrome c [Ignavibacteriaceae bacterium]|nr:cytochrome c [Ignavibacteriaceae bacterium]